MKVFPSQASGLLNPLPPPKEPWEQVTADFIVELPESQGYNVILVAADRHTKRAQQFLLRGQRTFSTIMCGSIMDGPRR
jgi:hypothetical protein